MPSLRIVITGRHGQLARSILEVGAARGAEVVAVGRPELELTDIATIEPAIAAARPQVLVNAAGYTDTERAEIEPAIPHVVNVVGAGAVAACARRLGVPIIHVSSSYVFDGLNAKPYREDDPVAPLGAYAKTKAQGEAAVAAAHPDHVILRTSLVFSPFGRNSLTNILRRAEQQSEIPVVTDQSVNPTAAADLAEGILAVARNLAGSANRRHFGIFHLAGREAATPAEFFGALLEIAAQAGGPRARVIPVTSAQLSSRVRRPTNSRLDCAKIAAVHGVRLGSWQEPLRYCVERFLASR